MILNIKGAGLVASKRTIDGKFLNKILNCPIGLSSWRIKNFHLDSHSHNCFLNCFTKKWNKFALEIIS